MLKKDLTKFVGRFIVFYLVTAVGCLLVNIITGSESILRIGIGMFLYGVPVQAVLFLVFLACLFMMGVYSVIKGIVSGELKAKDLKGSGAELGELTKAVFKHLFLFI